jgi:hypothetical protein
MANGKNPSKRLDEDGSNQRKQRHYLFISNYIILNFIIIYIFSVSIKHFNILSLKTSSTTHHFTSIRTFHVRIHKLCFLIVFP